MPRKLEFGDAAHLLRRAAARGNKQEAERLVGLGLEAAVDSLLRDPSPAPKYQTRFTTGERGQQLREISVIWLSHWLNTPTPAAERLTLFWHGHLTSEFRETNFAQGIDFWKQFETFRSLGYGPYGNLLKAIAKNPVMLLYLNNAQSQKEHPNENWARELMELYTTGPGFYSENDIYEAARAFTGWSVVAPSNRQARQNGQVVNRRQRDPNEALEFIFRRDWHDPQPKQFMGRTVQTGDDVLEILLAHPQTYWFVANKLLAYYLTPNPPANLVQEAAKTLQSKGTRETLRWLFSHDEFYSERYRNSIIKSPIEYVIGLLYAAGARRFDFAEINPQIAQRGENNPGGERMGPVGLFNLMGQIPFDPPNVKGWDGGLSWLAESHLLVRLNILGQFAGRERQLDLSVFMDKADGALALVKPEAQTL